MKKYLALVLLVCYSLSVWANAGAYLLCQKSNLWQPHKQCCCTKTACEPAKKTCANQCSLDKTDLTGVISSLPDCSTAKYVVGVLSPFTKINWSLRRYVYASNHGLTRWDKLYFRIEKIPKYLLYRVLII
ncbi:hypothetical protein SAMN05421780_106133 [Flexibacter flexilis DSM 6793]|uniref:Uncharacterized protein n=1 Tax=Flexibacter flexilis DSM 6793 TaxID=927664 RepID=A0A1I1JW22_9BACT|nr:hypothetical protein [Flexibacter flexilis]SFC52774.1 hypothetical protein SAMN05421780_106133 [Flexibacter flexilis DSM 6793]